MKVERQKVEESATQIGLIQPSCSDCRLAMVDPSPHRPRAKARVSLKASRICEKGSAGVTGRAVSGARGNCCFKVPEIVKNHNGQCQMVPMDQPTLCIIVHSSCAVVQG